MDKLGTRVNAGLKDGSLTIKDARKCIVECGDVSSCLTLFFFHTYGLLKIM